MNLMEFFNSIQKFGDDSFSFPLLETFLTTPNIPDLKNFFDIYKKDEKLVSNVDSKQYAKVIGELLEDHKSFGGSLESITKALQQNPDKMTISTYAIRNLAIPNERMHKFTINVSGVLLYDVVEKIYHLSKEMNYELDMEIPAIKDQKVGLTDTIVLYSSNNNLFNTIDFIKNVEKFKRSFGEQSKFYTQAAEGIVYDSFDEEHGKWSRDLVGETVIDAIDEMIEEDISNHPELYGEVGTVNYKSNRVNMIRNMMARDENVYAIFDAKLKDEFIKNDIDLDNIYVSKNVYEKFVGPRVTVRDIPSDELGSLEDLINQRTEELVASGKDEDLDEETAVPYYEDENLGIGDEFFLGDEFGEGFGDDSSLKENSEFIPLGENAERVDSYYGEDGLYSEEGLGSASSLEENPDFRPLGGDVERVDPLTSRVFGNPTLNLKPGEIARPHYLQPKPKGSLRLLDEMDKSINNGQVKDAEESGLESGRADIISDTYFNDQDEVGKENGDSLDEEISEALKEWRDFVEQDDKIATNSTGATSSFGENVTIPSEDLEIEEDTPNHEDVNLEGGLDQTPEENIPEDISEEEKHVGDVISEVFAKDFIDGQEEKRDEEVAKAEASVEEDPTFGLLTELMERSEKVDTEDDSKKESDQNRALREFQERRAAEIAEIEQHAKQELARMESASRNRREVPTHQEMGEKEQYLESLLQGLNENPGSLEEKYDRPVLPRIAIPSEKSQTEIALDNMLEALNHPVEPSSISEERLAIPTFEHVPSEEEQRLIDMENAALSGKTEGSQEVYFEPQQPKRKSAPIEKSEAEMYLDEVLSSLQEPDKDKEFDGFNDEMIAIESGDKQTIKPSDIFAAEVTREEAVEARKTPAEIEFDARLRALENISAERRSSLLPETGGKVKKNYKSEITPEHERLNELLEEALQPKDKKEFEGFNPDMFNDGLQEVTPSSLFEIHVDPQSEYQVSAKEKSKEEERMDSLLSGEYKEDPIVVIPEPERTEVSEREKSEEEERMDSLLEGEYRELPAVVIPDPERTKVSEREKSEEEKRMDSLLSGEYKEEQAVVIPEPERTEVSEREKSEEEERMESMLRGEYRELPAVVIPDHEKKEVVAREKSEEEERMDSLLDGKYKEDPAVIIPDPERTEVVARGISEHEEKLDEMLKNVDRPLPSILPQGEEIKPVIYVPKKHEGEEKLDKLLEETLNPKTEEETQDHEFTGFDEVEVGDGQYKEAAGSAEALLVPEIESKYQESEENMTSGEKYLEELLMGLSDGSDVKADDVDDQKTTLPDKRGGTTSAEEERLNNLYKEALLPKDPIIEEKMERHVSGIPSHISEKEEKLEDLLKQAEKKPEEAAFEGFDDIPLSDKPLDMVSGDQSLVAASLEEKIRQVAEMERNKSAQEKRMDELLRGEHKEEQAVDIKVPELVTPKAYVPSDTELAMDKELEEMRADSPSALFSGISRASEQNMRRHDEEGKSKESPSEIFSGFDENMLYSEESEAVKSARELFESAISLENVPIVPEEEKKKDYEDHLASILGPLDDIKKEIGEEEISDSRHEESDVSKTNNDEKTDSSEEQFTGFEEVFFDDRPEDEQLSEAMQQMEILPLGSDILSDDERNSLLDMDNDNKYQFIGVDVKTPIVDENGQQSTLYEYLERNNVLDVLPPNEESLTVDGMMSNEDFIRDKLVPNVIIKGNINFLDFKNEFMIPEIKQGIGYNI